MSKRILFLFAAFAITATAGFAQSELPDSVRTAMAVAESHMQKGEEGFKAGDFERARREFDTAVDIVTESGVDLRSSSELYARWRDMIERINRYQLAAAHGEVAGQWRTQDYVGRPEPQNSEPAEADLEAGDDEAPAVTLSPAVFQERLADLRNRFREKYGRDFIITGADHGEHRRLYGSGSAVDVRVHDLNRDQIRFILSAGRSLGLRIKDFSTPDRVAAHNARVITLGRPLDTLATGVHLHIDRMAGSSRGVVTTRAASVRRTGGSRPEEKDPPPASSQLQQ